MLVNCNSDLLVYILGTGAAANEINQWMLDEGLNESILLSHTEFASIKPGSQCILGFNDVLTRKKWLNQLSDYQIIWLTYVHPSAVITGDLRAGAGCVIGPTTVLGWNVLLGKFCSTCDGVNIGHNTELKNNIFLGPGTVIGGSSTIGCDVSIGMCSAIKDHVSVCNNVELLMSSVVTKDITVPDRYYGNRRVVQ